MKTTIATKDPDDNGNSLLVNIGDTQRYIAAATSDNTRSTYRSACSAPHYHRKIYRIICHKIWHIFDGFATLLPHQKIFFPH